jgi:hypothetical protein
MVVDILAKCLIRNYSETNIGEVDSDSHTVESGPELPSLYGTKAFRCV